MEYGLYGIRGTSGSLVRALCRTCLVLVALASPATAAEPTAIVEDVTAPSTGVAFMDYLFPDRVINLKRGETVTLGYLQSCLRESITGGHIVVGREKSSVKNGTVKRERVECDGGAMKLSSEQSGKSLVMVLRAPPGSSDMPKPSIEIFGASPVIKLVTGKGKISIERLDRHEDELNLTATKSYIDLAATGRSLKPGGLYRARTNGRTVVFKVNRLARSGAGPVIGRLITF
mgnify:CR=1 FL=1